MYRMEVPSYADYIQEGADGPEWYHGSPSGRMDRHAGGIHVGTKLAATQALEARIGIPADGKPWDGTREYGKTLLAGRKTLKKLAAKRGYFLETGHNCTAALEEDYLPEQGRERATYGDGTVVELTSRPKIYRVRIIGPMTNNTWTPLGDTKANATMHAMMSRGKAKQGYYYTNMGEDEGSISAVVPDGAHLKVLN